MWCAGMEESFLSRQLPTAMFRDTKVILKISLWDDFFLVITINNPNSAGKVPIRRHIIWSGVSVPRDVRLIMLRPDSTQVAEPRWVES